MVDFLQSCKKGTLLKVKVHPSARTTRVKGTMADMLKIDVAAQPRAGAANKELVAFLAKRLGLKKHQLSIQRGAGSRTKSIRIEGLRSDELEHKITSVFGKELS